MGSEVNVLICVYVYHMKFGDWWFSFLFIFHFWCRFMHLQYLPQILIPKRPIWDRFAVLFSVSIVWMYAQLLTSSGVYNNKPAKTQISCRTDRSGLFTAAPWWDFTNNVKYVFSFFFLPSSWKHRNLPSYFDEDTYLRLTFEYHNEQCKVTLMQLKAKFDHPFPQTQALDIIIMFNLNP